VRLERAGRDRVNPDSHRSKFVHKIAADRLQRGLRRRRG
jgi:hypothetical protein